MGAGLTVQRGWPQHTDAPSPQRSSNSGNTDNSSGMLMSPGSKAGITSFTRDQVHDETQPLGVGHVADGGGYHSTSTIRVQSLMPVDRHSRGNSGVADSEEGDSGTLGVGGDLAYELETPRVSRGPSTAYDLSDMSTEDEIRRRFTFHPERGWSMNNFAEDVMRKVGRKFRSPMAVLNFVLPISKTLQSYTKDKATRDLVVGITMATLMIPQGLAFATVAGIPLLYGLYIVWMPPFIYSLFGTSIHVSYGPFALMGLFMSNALEKRGYKPCDGICRHESEQIQEYLEACTIITFMVSIWYFIMAICKLGEPLAILLADPVINGFVCASAVLVANSQVCTFLQIQHPDGRDSGVVGTLFQAWKDRADINLASVGVGALSIVIYFALRRFNAYLKSSSTSDFFLPEALTSVLACTFFSWVVDLGGVFGVDIVGTIPPGLPPPKFPRLDKLTSLEQFEDLAGVALVAAIVSFIITHSIAKSLAGATEIKATPQLFAVGAANLVGSIFSSLPGSASLSRAAIIDSLNARTIVHNVFTFGLMTGVLLYLSPLLKFLPTSVLAAQIYAVIFKFFDFGEPFRLYRLGVGDSLMWVATFAATIGLSVRDGIVIGMGVSAFTLIQRSSTPLVMRMGRLPGTNYFRDIKSYPDAATLPGIEVMRFGAPLTFANKDIFRRTVIKLVERSDREMRQAERDGRAPKVSLQYLVLDSASIHDMDSSAIKMLEALVALLIDRHPPIEIFLAPVSDPLMLQIHKSPVLSATLGRRYFLSIDRAARYATEQVAGGTLIAPSNKYHKVMSNLSVGGLDEHQMHDI